MKPEILIYCFIYLLISNTVYNKNKWPLPFQYFRGDCILVDMFRFSVRWCLFKIYGRHLHCLCFVSFQAEGKSIQERGLFQFLGNMSTCVFCLFYLFILCHGYSTKKFNCVHKINKKILCIISYIINKMSCGITRIKLRHYGIGK